MKLDKGSLWGNVTVTAVAVLGAGGFIGSRVAMKLIERGYEVCVVAKNVPEGGVPLLAWEAADHRLIADLSHEKPDLRGCEIVFNFAADMGGVGYFSGHQIGPYIQNSKITFNVLEICAEQGIQTCFMASSACAYPIDLQMTADAAPKLSEDLLETGPADQMYGREKLMLIALARHASFDCRVGVLHTIYGDTSIGNRAKMKFPTTVALKSVEAIDSGRMTLWGDGRQLRSYLWIDDAVNKIILVGLGDTYEGPVNIGKEGSISVRDVAAICANALGIDPEISWDSNMPSGVLSRDCDNSKFQRLYGFLDTTSYDAGFRSLTLEIARKLSVYS